MTEPNLPQILAVFDQLMERHVNWRIATSFTKYAKARDSLINQIAQDTGIDRDVFHNHIALKNAKAMGLIPLDA
jgi:hypothetical protein